MDQDGVCDPGQRGHAGRGRGSALPFSGPLRLPMARAPLYFRTSDACGRRFCPVRQSLEIGAESPGRYEGGLLREPAEPRGSGARTVGAVDRSSDSVAAHFCGDRGNRVGSDVARRHWRGALFAFAAFRTAFAAAQRSRARPGPDRFSAGVLLDLFPGRRCSLLCPAAPAPGQGARRAVLGGHAVHGSLKRTAEPSRRRQHELQRGHPLLLRGQRPGVSVQSLQVHDRLVQRQER
jgi:hypothetical protein